MADKAYHSQLCDFLILEAQAIRNTVSRLDPAAVDAALELLINCEGKLILVGMGKSGNIAQKIAGTFTSVGMASVYLHPSDGLHGGLGIVSTGDVVIALSNSGETDEILLIIPYLKQKKLPIIAVVGNTESSLARKSDVVLDASVDKEACPLNLAPTTSTTVALAIGDALAMTAMQVKGLTEIDFARNHPGGRIGKRLTLRVADLMHTNGDNPVIYPEASWIEIVTAISSGGLGTVSVLNQAGVLEGIITDGDLRRALQRTDQSQLANLTGSTVMTRNPVVVSPDLLAYDALRLMEDRPRQISVLPVVNEKGLCVGIIRLHDIVRNGL